MVNKEESRDVGMQGCRVGSSTSEDGQGEGAEVRLGRQTRADCSFSHRSHKRQENSLETVDPFLSMAQQIPPNSMVGLWVFLSSYGLSVYVPLKGFPGGAVVENLPANAGDPGDVDLIPGLGRSPGIGNDNLLQCPCLENPVNREVPLKVICWNLNPRW